MTTPYTSDYYRALQEGSRKSAKAIVPLIMELIHPRSVIDIGCGTGTWLSVFKEHGVPEILGIDREHVPREILEISADEFRCHDLRSPLALDRRYDLAVCLEVAEHLPGECAETLVQALTRLGPAILFSAAIPFQGGTNHLNEQWPDYWAKRFDELGYAVLDPIRKRIWQRPDVECWYSQNILIFVEGGYLESRPVLRNELRDAGSSLLSLVHPRLFLELGNKHVEAVQKQELFWTEARMMREESERHRQTAEHYIAEADRCRAETAMHREKAEFYIEEARKCRIDMEEHRQKAEHFIAEADRCRAETVMHREKAEFYIEEARKYRKEMEEQRAEAGRWREEAEFYKAKSDPRNMSIKEVLKALPAIIASRARNPAGKRSKG